MEKNESFVADEVFTEVTGLKPFSQLTKAELAEVSDKDMETYIKYAKINNGIKLKPDPIKLEKPSLKGIKTKPAYWVIGDIPFHFATPELAQTIINLIKKNQDSIFIKDYISLGNGVYDYLTVPIKDRDLSIHEVSLYNIKDKEAVKDYLIAVKKYEEESRKQTKEVDKYDSQVEAIINPMYIAVREAKEELRTAKYIANEFLESYLPLAKGDFHMAFSFIKKAHYINELTLDCIYKYYNATHTDNPITPVNDNEITDVDLEEIPLRIKLII